jgi:hypothetical protein
MRVLIDATVHEVDPDTLDATDTAGTTCCDEPFHLSPLNPTSNAKWDCECPDAVETEVPVSCVLCLVPEDP